MLKRFHLILCLSASLFSANLFADERAELEQAIRQLESAKQALVRAQQQAKGSNIKTRFYFDYAKARKEIDTVRSGIYYYLNNDRAQPRDPRVVRTLSGEYEKVRVIK
ncbi:MAG: RAQPRD family integrative conjugative element protein [Pasteurella oralis]|uniref:integrative conjugative element protein, RAQPRD family n=1 Tax=Pasteurella oralis TaxID=1071947 RepID=UPI002708F740|nr:RAQPRD family integrative conjugative element protein [Pasteurella oralis]